MGTDEKIIKDIQEEQEYFVDEPDDDLTDEEMNDFLNEQMMAGDVDLGPQAQFDYMDAKGKHVKRITTKRKHKNYQRGIPGKTGVKTRKCVLNGMDDEEYERLCREKAFTPPVNVLRNRREIRIENQSAKKNIGRTARRNSVRETQDVLADFMCDAALEPAGNC